MNNQALIEKIESLSDQHNKHFRAGNFDKCNRIGKQIRELKPKADYGFRENELVEFKIRNRWMTGMIRKIDENWQVDLGHTVVPVELIRKYEHKPVAKQSDIFDYLEEETE